jgi:hypothetical protein
MPHDSPPAFLAALPDNALLAITGDDATAFLHAQLTNDVAAMKDGEAQWNGWCTAKGRLLATVLLVKRPDGYLAMLPAEIAPAIAKRLAMFVLRSKVKIRDASPELAAHGLAGPGAGRLAGKLAAHPELATAALGADLAVIVAPRNDPRIEDLRREARPGTTDEWHLALIRAGIPTIVAATQEAFVPQMANLDLVGAVSFRKGCYPGQEIVARTQYRGILKKRMALAHVEGAAPSPGESVYSPAFGDQSAGTVVNVAPDPAGGFELLVVAQIESLRDGTLRLGSPDGAPIAIRSHPAAEAAAQ